MTEFVPDWERKTRTGMSEAILCEGKSPEQIETILQHAGERRLLLTRFDKEKFSQIGHPWGKVLDYDSFSRTAFHGSVAPPEFDGPVIVCAGTSDLPVAREALRTLIFEGYRAPIIADVGVAGIWRLMQRIEEIRSFSVVIAVAGMEGALFSILAGLIDLPIIAVPTSVGYGVGTGGRVALGSALATCANGLVTVNIDNGFGAACAAIRILQQHSI